MIYAGRSGGIKTRVADEASVVDCAAAGAAADTTVVGTKQDGLMGGRGGGVAGRRRLRSGRWRNEST